MASCWNHQFAVRSLYQFRFLSLSQKFFAFFSYVHDAAQIYWAKLFVAFIFKSFALLATLREELVRMTLNDVRGIISRFAVTSVVSPSSSVFLTTQMRIAFTFRTFVLRTNGFRHHSFLRCNAFVTSKWSIALGRSLSIPLPVQPATTTATSAQISRSHKSIYRDWKRENGRRGGTFVVTRRPRCAGVQKMEATRFAMHMNVIQFTRFHWYWTILEFLTLHF